MENIPGANTPIPHYQNVMVRRRLNSLEQKFRPRPFYQKWKEVYYLNWIASYLINVLSAVTAATLVYVFLSGLTSSQHLILGATVLFVLLLEAIKRNLSLSFFKDYLVLGNVQKGLLIAVAFFTGVSIACSFYGSQELVHELYSATPLVEKDSFLNSIQQDIAVLDVQIEEARNTKWNGTTTVNSQRTIEALTKQKLLLIEEQLRRRSQQDQVKEQSYTDYFKSVDLQAQHFALVTLVLEILFLFSTWYIQYYDYRSYIELSGILFIDSSKKNVPTSEHENPNPVATNGGGLLMTDNIIDLAIKQAKSNLAAYQSKLKNGNGSEATIRKGIRRWQQKIEELQKTLRKKEHSTKES